VSPFLEATTAITITTITTTTTTTTKATFFQDLFSVMIKGPERTPYEDGLFFFDMQLPPDYPKVLPLPQGTAINPRLTQGTMEVIPLFMACQLMHIKSMLHTFAMFSFLKYLCI
jgi:hypothetical protein